MGDGEEEEGRAEKEREREKGPSFFPLFVSPTFVKRPPSDGEMRTLSPLFSFSHSSTLALQREEEGHFDRQKVSSPAV